MRGKALRGVVIAAAAVILSACPALASGAIVLGDSIGVGISMASGAPRLAHNGVGIRSADAISQIRRAPSGSVAILSLGTNDAVGSIAGVEQGIERIVSAAQETGKRVVWVGPPCVLKAWSGNVQRLDQILRARLSGRDGVSYVSAADQSLCNPGLKAGDGVHFTMRGYGILWARARQAAGLPEQASTPPPAAHQRAKKAKSRPTTPARKQSAQIETAR